MVLGLKKLIFHFCSNNYFLHFVIFCQMSTQSILCCLKKIGTKKMKPMVSEAHHNWEHERCCCTASIFNLHPFLVGHSFSTKGQHSYFNHEKKQKYEKNHQNHLFSPDFDAISRLTGGPNPLFSHFQKERAGRREFEWVGRFSFLFFSLKL